MKAKHTRMDSASARPSADRPVTPNVPLASGELAFDTFEEGVRFAGGWIPLGELGGARQVGVNLQELPPGKQSCPFHYHQREEEHFFVLSGRCVLRTSEGRFEMKEGDYVCFPAGTGVAHCFENPFDAPCRLITIGTRDPDEIAVYPDSGKMKLRALDRIVPFTEETLDYWTGERPDEPLT